MNTNTATEYRNLPLAVLTESATNPRRIFEDSALKELAESIRSQGVLSPLLVRPLTDQGFEIIAGARRYRAAQMAETTTVPVRIVNLTDAEALEAQLNRKPATPRRPPTGGGARIQGPAQLGRPEIQHRASCREGWQGLRHQLHRCLCAFEVGLFRGCGLSCERPAARAAVSLPWLHSKDQHAGLRFVDVTAYKKRMQVATLTF